MNSCEQIRTAMMAYDWIGFDLFDTLLLRPFLQPDDLFCQMEQELQVPDFAALRSQTENQLKTGTDLSRNLSGNPAENGCF